MPEHPEHRYVDRQFVGKDYPDIHKGLDWPVSILGRGHRVLFHDYETAMVIAKRKYPLDPYAPIVAVLHIDFDSACSSDAEYKKILEVVRKRDEKQRKEFNKYVKRLEKAEKARIKKEKAALDKILNFGVPKKTRRKKKTIVVAQLDKMMKKEAKKRKTSAKKCNAKLNKMLRSSNPKKKRTKTKFSIKLY